MDSQESTTGHTPHLYFGDNLDILRKHISDESIDLIYLDPPFNKNADFNLLFESPSGDPTTAQSLAFKDTWSWDTAAQLAFDQVLASPYTQAAAHLYAWSSVLKHSDMMAYLAMMAIRLLELHRVLKPTGSLYLHCDPTASHYIKILLDAVFGLKNFRSEIIWKRTSAHNDAKKWGAIHDSIFFYVRGKQYTWKKVYQPYDASYIHNSYRRQDPNGRQYTLSDLTGPGRSTGRPGQPWRGFDPTAKGRMWSVPRDVPGLGNLPADPLERLEYLYARGRIEWPKRGKAPRFKRYLDEMSGRSLQDVITHIPALSSHAKERLGYPTQKPLALLEPIIQASSNEGDVILDPFCGCGTAVHAAQRLRRRWIGIDVTYFAVSLIDSRLHDAFPGIHINVKGIPKSLEDARALWQLDPHKFENWAVILVHARPLHDGKKGSDGGADGIWYFKPDGIHDAKVLVEVKGGTRIGVRMIRDFAHVIEREKASIGLFLTLTPPTRDMREEAIGMGFLAMPYHEPIPKMQIFTIEELLAGKRPRIPFSDPNTFRHAQPEEHSEQQPLL